MVDLTYFTADELRCNGSGKVLLADGFGEQLDALRASYGKPMIITSGCRSIDYNEKIGGHPNSSHVFDHPDRYFQGTYGVDIAMRNSHERGLLINNAWDKGWCIGVAGTFLHLDCRRDYFPNYPQVVFTY